VAFGLLASYFLSIYNEERMMTTKLETDCAASQEYQPLPEIAALITKLNELDKAIQPSQADTVPGALRDALRDTIKLLENGEPFHPEPKPGSGQYGWRDTAAMMSRNADFYQGIVTQVGEILGVEAYTANDGTVGDSVLALKVPELVKKLKENQKV
jgi:hypothetical protein